MNCLVYDPSLQVAPVLDAGERSRPIYLPAGRWLGRANQVIAMDGH